MGQPFCFRGNYNINILLTLIIEYAVVYVICFNAVAFQTAPARLTESVIYHFLLFPWRTKGYWSVGFMSLGKQTPRWIVTHKLVANISSTQKEDVCILTKFLCWLYQVTTEDWETTEESLQDIDLQVWAMSLSQLSLLYSSLVARLSVGPPALP